MILVLGAKGQLGSQLSSILSEQKFAFVATDYESLDITNKVQLENMISLLNPKVIINTAAFTNVNAAEYKNRDIAYKINTKAIKYICDILNKKKIEPYIIHISTDYVFDGSIKDRKNFLGYTEEDMANPVNFYGKTKKEGEVILEKEYEKFYIIRTSWLFGMYGENFVKKITRKILLGENVSVVHNQFGSPTSSFALSNVICKILHIILKSDTLKKNSNILPFGIYHFSSCEVMSWFNFAQEINSFALLNYPNLIYKNIFPLTDTVKNDQKDNVVRPYCSYLNCDKIIANLSLSPTSFSWRQECYRIIQSITS